MRILTKWLRVYLPNLAVDDARLAEDLTLRGIAVDGIYDLGDGNGSLYEMDITTNRVDAMNHYGVAREAAAIYGLALPVLDFALPKARQAAKRYPVRIEAEDACGRFTARVLRGIKVGDSRDWFAGAEVAAYFGLLEQKQIMNAVDATNFAWLAMGQPTHAFDLDKVEGGIVVRRAKKGERLKTLDGVERILDPDDLVVADHARALALAGVMGGWETMITLATTNVLVEAAWFEPMAVRQTARRHGLHTDASHRFERGADFNAAPVASALVSRILLENGGWIEGELVDVRIAELEARTVNRKPVALALSEIRRILGATVDEEGITAETVEGVLTALGCGLASQQVSESASQREAEAAWLVTLPSWRLDLEREIDLIEEVARVYGYNRFANTLPAFGEGVRALPWAESEAAVRRSLLAAGFHEAIASTFCSAEEARLTAPQPGLVVPLGNPLSEEAGVLRPSLVPGMLGMIAGNLHRDVSDVRLFEIGTVFSGAVSNGTVEKVEERPAVAFGAVGSLPEQGALHAARTIDFHDLKGAVEQVLAQFEARAVYFDRFPAEAGLTPEWLHPYRAARVAVEGATVGWLGQLHPREAAARKLAAASKLKEPVLVGELDLDRLYKLPLRKPIAQEISRFQPVRRDFSLVLDRGIGWEKIDQALAGLKMPELVEWRAREVFRDAKLGADEYSLLLGATFQAVDRTLREEELKNFQARVVEAVGKVGARLRS
ncbi:MAG: phenylalanine--tRNA ligase subunit beta [Terracidiphilus sp.]